MPQKRPAYVQNDIDRAKKKIEDTRKAGGIIDPSMFSGGLLYKPYSGTALNELLQSDNQNTVIPQSSITTNRSAVAPIQSPISQTLPPTSKSLQKEQKQSRVKIDAPLDDLITHLHGAFNPESSPNLNSDLISASQEGAQNTVATNNPQPYQDYIQRTQESVPELPLKKSAIQPPSPVVPQYNKPVEESMYDRLNKLLDNPPLRGDYEPSKLRKIGGAITGGLTGAAYGPKVGSETASNIVDQPYREAYQDWATRTGALEKGIGIDINRQKAEIGGLSDIASYLRAQAEINPETQGKITGAKTKAEEGAKEPGRKNEAERKLDHDLILNDLQAAREKERDIRLTTGRKQISDQEIKSRERMALATINSRENIARLNRDLKKQIAEGKNQRIPPNQQYLGQIMAENEVAKAIANPDEFSALFNETKDKDGKSIVTLKAKSEITNPEMLKKYQVRVKQIDTLKKELLKNSYSPSQNEFDINDNSDDFDIEEVTQ